MFNILTGEKDELALENANLKKIQQKLETEIKNLTNERESQQKEIQSVKSQSNFVKPKQEEIKKIEGPIQQSAFQFSENSSLKGSLFDQNPSSSHESFNKFPHSQSYNIDQNEPPELSSFEKYQESLNKKIKEQLERDQKQFPQNNSIFQQSHYVSVPPVQQPQPPPIQPMPELYTDMQGHTNTITTLISLPRINNHDLIVSVSEDKMLRVWDLGGLKCVQILSGHTGHITDVCFVESKNLLMTVSQDCTLRVWEMQTGQCKKIVRAKYPLKNILFFQLHHIAVVGSSDKKLRLISPEDNNFREELCTLEGEVNCLCGNTQFKADSQIVAGDRIGKLYLIEPDFEQKKSRIIGLFSSKIVKERKAHGFPVICVQMIKKLRMLLSCAFEEQYLKVWSLNLELIREIKLCEIRNQINCLQFEERTSQIIIGTSDEQLIVLNSDFNIVKQFKKEALGISAVCINPESNILIYAGNYYDNRLNKINNIIRVRKSIF